MGIAYERVHFDQFSTVISNSGYQTLRTYNVLPDRVIRLELTVAVRQSDGNERATFKRIGLFYRVGSNPVLHQGLQWLSTDTIKSNPNIDVRYILGPSTITIEVKNASNIATRWTGHVDIVNVK